MPTIEILRRETDLRAFGAGETILKLGDAGNCLFAVIEGTVAIDIGGVVVEEVAPGGIFGEMALIDHAPRSASARAATDCRIAAIDEKRFLRLVEQTPRFALQVMQVITERLRRAHRP